MNASRLLHLLFFSTLAIACFGCGTKERTPLELAEHHFLRPDYEQALEACEAALEQAQTPDLKAAVHVLRGRCYLGQGHDAKQGQDSSLTNELYEKAVVEFSAALNLDGDNLDALHNRRIAYRLTNQPDLAGQDYALIRKVDPAYRTAYQNEPTEDLLPKKRPKDTLADDETKDNTPDESEVAFEEPSVESRAEPSDAQENEDTRGKGVVDSAIRPRGKTNPGPKISVADFEPSATDPSSRLSQWLSQHHFVPGLNGPRATAPSDLEQTLTGINPDETAESDDDVAEDEPNRPTVSVPPPANWPSSSQWPQFPTQHSPTLPTGIVGPNLHPPAGNAPPALPYRGIVAPTGSTGVGAEPIPNRSAPYANQTLPTTGITGTLSPYRAPGSSMVPYRPTLPEGLRQQQPDAADPRTNPRIPKSLQPNVPSRPTSPRPTLQYQTSPLSSPSVRPGS